MPLKTHLDEAPTLNLTPMIDVLFLLLIFFMLGAKFTELERSVPVKVPQVSDVDKLPQQSASRTINVTRDGRISLDRQFVKLEELGRVLTAERAQSELRVLVRGDADTSFQTVAAVLNTCRQAGVTQLGVSVRLAQQQAETTKR